MSNLILTAKHISKSFTEAKHRVDILTDINLQLHKGELLAIVGRSGSGKSTLLHILGGLEKPSGGQVLWGEKDIALLSEAAKSKLRNCHLGFIYQFHHLLPEFCAWENVAMPLLLRNVSPKNAKSAALGLLQRVGLADRVDHKIGELSGGERQRVAIARALVTKPACVLADEPTGNLDKDTSQSVFDLLIELQKSEGVAFIMVTHDTTLAKAADRLLVLDKDGLQAF